MMKDECLSKLEGSKVEGIKKVPNLLVSGL